MSMMSALAYTFFQRAVDPIPTCHLWNKLIMKLDLRYWEGEIFPPNFFRVSARLCRRFQPTVSKVMTK
jgi:hypothetical protein